MKYLFLFSTFKIQVSSAKVISEIGHLTDLSSGPLNWTQKSESAFLSFSSEIEHFVNVSRKYFFSNDRKKCRQS